MKKIVLFLVNFANLALAYSEACSIVADCNANIEARLSSLESQNEDLVAKMNYLEAKNEKLEAENQQLEADIGQLKADVVELEEMVLPGKTPATVEHI